MVYFPILAKKRVCIKNERKMMNQNGVVADSKHRMEDVYKLIPDSLSDVYLENTGWHRGCHQRFKMNLNWLQSKSQATLEDAQPSSSRSP